MELQYTTLSNLFLFQKHLLKYVGVKNHNVYHIFSNDSTKLYKDKGNMEKCQQLLSLRRRRAGVYCTVFQLFCVFEVFPR